MGCGSTERLGGPGESGADTGRRTGGQGFPPRAVHCQLPGSGPRRALAGQAPVPSRDRNCAHIKCESLSLHKSRAPKRKHPAGATETVSLSLRPVAGPIGLQVRLLAGPARLTPRLLAGPTRLTPRLLTSTVDHLLQLLAGPLSRPTALRRGPVGLSLRLFGCSRVKSHRQGLILRDTDLLILRDTGLLARPPLPLDVPPRHRLAHLAWHRPAIRTVFRPRPHPAQRIIRHGRGHYRRCRMRSHRCVTGRRCVRSR